MILRNVTITIAAGGAQAPNRSDNGGSSQVEIFGGRAA